MEFAGYVHQLESLYLSSGGIVARPRPIADLLPDVPRRILIIAPHPDDECLMAGLALRAREEVRAEVSVLPYTFGSDPARQAARRSELVAALSVLGFELVDPRDPSTFFALSEREILRALDSVSPDLVILPHSDDLHPTHVRCSNESRSAVLRHQNQQQIPITILESEYWHPIREPNLLVPLPASIVAIMGEALMRHQGEIQRNPYHLSLPAWLMDQERRGTERVQGMGSKPRSPSQFSQLYRLTRITSEAGS